MKEFLLCRKLHFIFKLIIFVTLSREVQAGCRWSSPKWKQNLDSAPIVRISSSRIVTVSWGKDKLQNNYNCIDKFEVGVEIVGDQDQRKLCSVAVNNLVDNYSCKLNVSNSKYCDQRFGFWVTAVNVNHFRGVERIQSFANTIIDIPCNKTKAPTEQVLSKSCYAIEPTWITEPYVQQTDQTMIQISWDIRQIKHGQCVKFFLLKYSKISEENKYTLLKFLTSPDRYKYSGTLKVEQCNVYSYHLTMSYAGGKTMDIKDNLTIPCDDEFLLTPSGSKYVPELDINNNLDTEEENNNRFSEFSLEPEEGFGLNNRVRSPSILALESTSESITWMLSGLDPKIKIDKYQVSCWDEEGTNVGVDLPCCKVEAVPPVEGKTETLLTIGRLEPNTSYLCQGGLKIKDNWLFSPKALRMTENNSRQNSNNVLMLNVFIIFTELMS